MTLPKIKDINTLNYSDIQETIILTKKEIFDLRLKIATRQSVKPHIMKHKKRLLAHLLTLEAQLEKKSGKD